MFGKIREFFDAIVEYIRSVLRGIEYAFDPEGTEKRSLEEYRSIARVTDMAHSGDPSTLVGPMPDGSFMSIVEYYKRYEPGQYETWRRLCGNSGLDPDKQEEQGHLDRDLDWGSNE